MSFRSVYTPVAKPSITRLERNYVSKAVRSTWIGSKGFYLDRAAEEFATVCGVDHVALVSNGTVALHLAMLALDIKHGDEVIVPDLTYVAVPNAVRYCQATPIFCQISQNDWNIDPTKIAELITERTRALVVVNSFGRIADYDAIREILLLKKRSDIKIIEDASQSHLAYVGKRKAGSFGDLSTFSFFANKILTSGEGGAVCSSDKSLIERVNFLKNQAIESRSDNYFYFSEIGFNYRMTNIAAAILCAQIERSNEILTKRLEIYDMYNSQLCRNSNIRAQPHLPNSLTAPWLYPILVTNSSNPNLRDQAINYLREKSIESRPFFSPLSKLPEFQALGASTSPDTESLCNSGLNLPTFSEISKREIKFISQTLIKFLESFSQPAMHTD